MPTVSIAPIGTASFLVREANGYRSRDEVVIASGSGILKAGTVLGKITASGKFTDFDAGAADGTQTAAGILFEEVDATAADVKRTVVLRDCEVQKSALLFTGTPTTPQKTAAYASLTLLGVIMR